MASELPYLSSYKNVEKLFQKIATAKQPDAFTQKFLGETLGLKSPGDRPLIPLLRTLGFLDPSSKPTAEYAELRNHGLARKTMATAIRRAYDPLFAANEKANELTGDTLKGLIAQVAGADAGLTTKIVGTFNSLAKLADFSDGETPTATDTLPEPQTQTNSPKAALRPEFHYDIQIHLPSNAGEETYINIFNALRKTFQ